AALGRATALRAGQANEPQAGTVPGPDPGAVLHQAPHRQPHPARASGGGLQRRRDGAVRLPRGVRQPQLSSKVTMRFETEPGQQAQFDWSPYTIELGGELRRVVVYGMTLGYSRRKHYTASLDERQGSIFEAIEECLWHFGGAAKELLVDNPKAFVLDTRPAHFRWNPQFLELCGHYRIKPRACIPYRPRTKGKIERPFFYLEQQFIQGHQLQEPGPLPRGTGDLRARRP